MPVLLITGPFLPDATLSIFSLIVLIYIIKNKYFDYLSHPILKILLLLYLSFLISSLLSDDFLFSFENSLFYFRYIVFAFVISYISFNTNFLKNFFLISIFSILILSFDGYWEFFTDFNFFLNNKTDDPSRIASLFRDELIFGSYLSRMTPIIFGLFYYFNFHKTKYSYLFIIFTINIYTLVFLSGERTAFIMINLFLFLYFIKFLQLKKTLAVFITLFLIIILITSTNTIVKDRMVTQTKDSIFSVYNTDSKILPGVYDNMLKTSINMFKDNIFFGIGPKMYRKKCDVSEYGINKESCFTHPHNNYIQLISETGLVGILIFFSYYIYFFKQLILKILKPLNSYNKKDYLSFFMITSIFVNFFPFIPSGSFFNNWLNIFYFIPLGIYLYSQKETYKG